MINREFGYSHFSFLLYWDLGKSYPLEIFLFCKYCVLPPNLDGIDFYPSIVRKHFLVKMKLCTFHSNNSFEKIP